MSSTHFGTKILDKKMYAWSSGSYAMNNAVNLYVALGDQRSGIVNSKIWNHKFDAGTNFKILGRAPDLYF